MRPCPVSIVIGDLATLTDICLSTPDLLAKPGLSLLARETSVKGMRDALLDDSIGR